MSERRPNGGSWRGRASKGQLVCWRLFQALALGLLIFGAWRVLGHIPYRIDVEVYRMGAQAWLDGRPLYTENALFHTLIGLNLPFTYPPVAAIALVPFAWLPFPTASVAMTVITLVLLLVSTWIVLTRLDVWPSPSVVREPAWARRCWLTAAIVGAAVIHLEPIQANLAFGQINVILMTLVIADCLPGRTPWPRGLLLGIAIALKLTPAVFLLYFALRRDGRAMLVALGTFTLATLAGFAFAWRESVEYWTGTLRDTERIGSAALNTNQNIAGVLARLQLGHTEEFVIWTVACFAVLGLAAWAAMRVLRAGEPVLALICIALFGLVVSPVSWSHHWVWALPTVIATGVVAYRRRSAALATVTLVGLALMVWKPLELLPQHQEPTASLWRQLAGASYVWWAVAVLVSAGLAVAGRVAERTSAQVAGIAVPAAG